MLCDEPSHINMYKTVLSDYSLDGAKANCEAKGEKLAVFATEDFVACIREPWSAIGLECKT